MKSSFYLIVIVWLLAISCNRQQKSLETIAANEMRITTTLNAYLDSCWNKGSVSSMDDIISENFIRNLNGIKVANNQKEMQAHMTIYFTGFPDLEVHLDSTYVKDNAIFTHWTSTGTHTGVFGEMAATGKKMKIGGLSQLYFNHEGKLIREDVVFNELELLQQLGYTLTPPVLE